MLLIFMTKVFPLSQCRTTTEDYVFPGICSTAGDGQNDAQQNEKSHGGKMGQPELGGK